MARIKIDSNATHVQDYEVRQATTIEHLYSFEVNGTAKNLSAVTVTLDLVSKAGTAEIAARAVTTGGASANEFKLLITATDAATLEGEHQYQIKAVFPNADSTFSDGATKILVAGTIDFLQPIA